MHIRRHFLIVYAFPAIPWWIIIITIPQLLPIWYPTLKTYLGLRLAEQFQKVRCRRDLSLLLNPRQNMHGLILLLKRWSRDDGSLSSDEVKKDVGFSQSEFIFESMRGVIKVENCSDGWYCHCFTVRILSRSRCIQCRSISSIWLNICRINKAVLLILCIYWKWHRTEKKGPYKAHILKINKIVQYL